MLTETAPVSYTHLQTELNDLIRDLHLTKEASELFGSRLKDKNLLAAGASFSWFRYREKDFILYFSEEEMCIRDRLYHFLSNLFVLLDTRLCHKIL